MRNLNCLIRTQFRVFGRPPAFFHSEPPSTALTVGMCMDVSPPSSCSVSTASSSSSVEFSSTILPCLSSPSSPNSSSPPTVTFESQLVETLAFSCFASASWLFLEVAFSRVVHVQKRRFSFQCDHMKDNRRETDPWQKNEVLT